MCCGCPKEAAMQDYMETLQKQFDRQEFDNLHALVCG